MHGIGCRWIEYGSSLAVAERLREPCCRDRAPPREIVNRRDGHQSIEILRKPLCFHQDRLAAFRAACHIGVLNWPAVVAYRYGLGRKRDHVIAAPCIVILKHGGTGSPEAVESGIAFVAPVSGDRGVSTRQARITSRAVRCPAQAAAGRKKEVLIPIGRQRQPQFELVLRRDIAVHSAVLLDAA